MTVLFLASTRLEFASVAADVATAGFFDSLYQSSGLASVVEDSGVPFSLRLPATITGSLWVHYRLFHNRNSASGMTNANGQVMSFLDANNVLLGRIKMLSGQTRVEVTGDTTVNGAYWTWPVQGAPTLTMDVRVQVTASTIVFEHYVNGALVSTATAANTVGAKTGVRTVLYEFTDIQGTNGSASGDGFGEFIVTENESTIGWRLASLKPDGAGFYTAWGGDWTHLTSPDDGRFLTTAVTGVRESWTLSNYAAPATPESIRGVFMTLRGDRGVTGPQTIKGFLRLSSVDYDSSAAALAFDTPLMFEWALNPATGLAWDTTVFNAMEAGVRSET